MGKPLDPSEDARRAKTLRAVVAVGGGMWDAAAELGLDPITLRRWIDSRGGWDVVCPGLPRPAMGRRPIKRVEILALAKSGLSNSEIAAKIGVTTPTVTKALREAGMGGEYRKRRSPQHVPLEKRKAVESSWLNGLSVKEIKAKLGMSYRTIAEAFAEMLREIGDHKSR